MLTASQQPVADKVLVQVLNKGVPHGINCIPYGLKAVNELGGLPYSGSTRQFLIDPAGYAVNIFNGSIVALNTSGYLNIVTTNGDASTPFPAGTIGVFVGCSFVNAQGQVIYSQYYPAGTTGVVTAYVIDDDRAVFKSICRHRGTSCSGR